MLVPLFLICLNCIRCCLLLFQKGRTTYFVICGLLSHCIMLSVDSTFEGCSTLLFGLFLVFSLCIALAIIPNQHANMALRNRGACRFDDEAKSTDCSVHTRYNLVVYYSKLFEPMFDIRQTKAGILYLLRYFKPGRCNLTISISISHHLIYSLLPSPELFLCIVIA